VQRTTTALSFSGYLEIYCSFFPLPQLVASLRCLPSSSSSVPLSVDAAIFEDDDVVGAAQCCPPDVTPPGR